MSLVTDEVVLRVPAEAEFGRVVRVGGAAVAIRQGLSFTEIDELRLAIDESVILLLDGASEGSELLVVFRFTEAHLELEINCADTKPLTDEAIARFDGICSPLLDSYDLDPERGRLTLHKSAADHN